jgi:hypothetical protein
MRYVFLPALFVLIAFANQAYGCSMAFAHAIPPNPDAVRLSGVIAGYRSARPVGLLTPAPTLYIRIREVVSGIVQGDDAEVAPLGYGADCRSEPYQRQSLEKTFPIGTAVVVFGVARVRDASTPVVVAEANRSQYVVRIPQSVPRTANGDADFQRINGRGPFLKFEVDRIILTVAKSPLEGRVSRLKNLAYYFANPDLYMPTVREVYGRLVSTSGIPDAEGRALLATFDQLRRQPR